jgi:hypothetical protein
MSGTFAAHTILLTTKSCKRAFPLPMVNATVKPNNTILIHPDSFKINPTHNSDGLINWLPQPGLLRN